MLFLKILGCILILLLLLCFLKVGVRIRLEEETRVTLILGPIRLQILPKKPGHEKKPKKKKEKPKQASEEEKKSPKPDWEDIKSACRMLWPPLKKALRRTRRGIRVDPMQLSVVLGGAEEPADAAQNSGYLQAAVWTVMPALEQLLDIPHPGIHIGTDFQCAENRIRGDIGITIRIGSVFLVGFGILIPAAKWFLRFRKRHRESFEKTGAKAAPEKRNDERPAPPAE